MVFLVKKALHSQVEIDPQGLRVGASVRVISKYPVSSISKITSKKSARMPTRCFYFKVPSGDRKPYLGFQVTFETEHVAKDCTSVVGDACRRSMAELVSRS